MTLNMPARAIWKGVLKLGSSGTPVKLYAAVQDRKVHFHVLQSKTKSRVKQHMVRETGAQVPKEDLRKGYEVEPGTFVVLEDKELDRLKPEESRDLQATRFIPHSQLSNEWYERPYYLGPDGDNDGYFALVKSIQSRQVLGIVRWTMRAKAYIGALTTQDGYLLLIKTRYAEEVLPLSTLSAPAGPALDEKELRMAQQLLSALEGTFEPAQFRDEYRQRVQDFVEAKAKGKHPRLPMVKERTAAASLDVQLAKSLKAVVRGREKQVA
jgi:DNA end-binding protein Ku